MRRIVLAECSRATYSRMMGGDPRTGAVAICWAMTPDFDVYPEELAATPLRALMGARPGGPAVVESGLGRLARLNRARGFSPPPTPAALADAMRACRGRVENRVGASPRRLPPREHRAAAAGGAPTRRSRLHLPPPAPSGQAGPIGLPSARRSRRCWTSPGRFLRAVARGFCPVRRAPGAPRRRRASVALVSQARARIITCAPLARRRSAAKGPPSRRWTSRAATTPTRSSWAPRSPRSRGTSLGRGTGGRSRPSTHAGGGLGQLAPRGAPRGHPVPRVHLFRRNVRPRAGRARRRHACRLTSGDPGVSDHETAMEGLEYMLTFDQLNAPEPLVTELFMRRAQLAEFCGRHHPLRPDDFGDDLASGEFLHLGLGEARG
ncbi:unnamed protein product [Prorocentrum cordatum]|uniref:Uncharacterized protein n=1 Tax=Prorocentrum cordatum TaxID=2364126 RepID=A0ABN9WGB8_9DINO|nr:unnamed protein product [Polarella glacialis]